MEGETGQPLVTPDHMGGSHQMIIHCVGEVIGGNAVGFQQNLVDVVFRNGEVSLYQVLVLELVLGGSGGAEAKDPGAAHGQLSLNFFQAPSRQTAQGP